MSETTNTNIKQKVINLIVNNHNVDAEEISLNSHFSTDLNFDSLEVVEFIMNVEEEFRINVPDDISENILTVKDAIESIESIVRFRSFDCSTLSAKVRTGPCE